MVVGGAATSMNREAALEGPSHRSLGSPTSLSIQAKSSPHHGDFLLAVSRSCNLGIHYPLPREVPAAGAGVCHLFSGSTDSLGHAVPFPTGDHDFVSGGAMGKKPDESLRQSAYTRGVSGRDDRHEHFQGDLCIGRHGALCMALLWL